MVDVWSWADVDCILSGVEQVALRHFDDRGTKKAFPIVKGKPSDD